MSYQCYRSSIAPLHCRLDCKTRTQAVKKIKRNSNLVEYSAQNFLDSEFQGKYAIFFVWTIIPNATYQK